MLFAEFIRVCEIVDDCAESFFGEDTVERKFIVQFRALISKALESVELVEIDSAFELVFIHSLKIESPFIGRQDTQ